MARVVSKNHWPSVFPVTGILHSIQSRLLSRGGVRSCAVIDRPAVKGDEMRFAGVSAFIFLLAQQVLAPTGTLRAVYLATNPAHAVKDATTGEALVVVSDLTAEFARRLGTKVSVRGVQSPQNVMDAVERGEADIGFVAYNPERAGPVEFSQTYMLVQQTFIVRDDSHISSVANLHRPNQKIGST